jgi:trans-aconitate methyltransferase
VAVAMGAKVYATEISAEKIAYARTLGIEVVDPSVLPEMRFDLIHTEQVFEHLTDPATDFQTLSAALAADGILKIAVPPQGRIRHLLKTRGMIDRSPQESEWNSDVRRRSDLEDYVSILPLEHLNAYSTRSIECLARQNSMAVVSRVRRQSVPLSTLSASLLSQSLIQLAKVTLRPLVRRSAGYYLLAKSERASAPIAA